MEEKAGNHSNVGYVAGTESIDFKENQNTQQGQFAPQPMPYTQQPQAGYWAPPQQQYGGQPAFTGQIGTTLGTTVIIQQQEPVPPGTYGALNGAYATSCITYWCCNFLFGAIGFFIALGASDAMTSQNYDKARRLAYAAIGVSVAGIVVTAILVAVIVGLCMGGTTTCYGYFYYYNVLLTAQQGDPRQQTVFLTQLQTGNQS